jgi:hypothetical protein
VSEEKGWWEAKDSPEVEPSPEAESSLIFPPDSFKEVEVGERGPVVWMLAGLLFLFMLYLENRMSTSDSIFWELCCVPLLWILFL